MSLFGAMVRTVVNVVTIPAAVVKDVCTLGGALTDEPPATVTKVEQIKREASPSYDEREAK